MLEGRNLAERMPVHMIRRRATRRKNIHRNKLLSDPLLLKRETHRPDIDTVGRAKDDRFVGGTHITDRGSSVE